MLDCVIIVLDFVRSFCVICQAFKKIKSCQNNTTQKPRIYGICWTLYLNTVLIIATL
nr:MAG TPA: hypothetical protein [Caudoviricetes sp.]